MAFFVTSWQSVSAWSKVSDKLVCHRGIWPSRSNFKVNRSNMVIFQLLPKMINYWYPFRSRWEKCITITYSAFISHVEKLKDLYRKLCGKSPISTQLIHSLNMSSPFFSYDGLLNVAKMHLIFPLFALLLWPYVTSSLKPKVHNMLQRRQRRTEPPPQGICTKNSWRSVQRFERYARGQTDKHTQTHT